jgi:chemotaxis signal transduction protein
MEQEMLIFEASGQRHGLPAAQVQELLPALAVLPVPGARAPLEGIINLRGVVIPVLDMRRCLGPPAAAEPGATALSEHFIVVRAQGRLLALHVGRALELVRVKETAVASAGVSGDGRALRVAKLETGMVLLHQADDFLPAATALVPDEGAS